MEKYVFYQIGYKYMKSNNLPSERMLKKHFSSATTVPKEVGDVMRDMKAPEA